MLVVRKMVRIGNNMEPSLKKKVITIVRQYHDVFTRGSEQMPGLDPKKAKPQCAALGLASEAEEKDLRYGETEGY